MRSLRPLPRTSKHALTEVNAAQVEAGQFADPQTRSVEQFQNGAVAAHHGLAVGDGLRDPVQKIVHLLFRHDAGKRLVELGRGDRSRRIGRQHALFGEKLIKRPHRRQLARDGGFLLFALEEHGQKSANAQRVNGPQVHLGFRIPARQVIPKLQQVALIIANRMRRGVALVAEVVDVAVEKFSHSIVPCLWSVVSSQFKAFRHRCVAELRLKVCGLVGSGRVCGNTRRLAGRIKNGLADGVARIGPALSTEAGNIAFSGGRVYASDVLEDKMSQCQA